MDANYKLHWIISRAERDTTNQLFRARVIIVCPRTRQEEDIWFDSHRVGRRENIKSSAVKVMRVPAEGHSRTKPEAERYGIKQAKKWIDDNIKPKP